MAWCFAQLTRMQVLGLDLANIQPAQYVFIHLSPLDLPNLASRIPPNVRFQIPFNFEGFWSLGQDSWDLIHLQMLCGSVSSWPNLYEKIFSYVKWPPVFQK